MNDRTAARPAPPGAAPEPEEPPPYRGPLGLAVSGLLLGMFLAMLDGLVVGTALPTVVGELGGPDHLSWVVTAYLLAGAATTPLWGKAGDLYGRKGAFTAAIGLFLAGSVLAGLSRSMDQLIAFRAVQGLGAGGLMVGAIALIRVLVPLRRSARVQSLIGVVLPVAFVGGPLVGGFLTERVGWRWTFYVNLPLGALALLLVTACVRLRSVRVRARIDAAGIVLLTTAVVAFTLLASRAGTGDGWTSPTALALAAAGAAATAGFLRAERRAAEPLIPLRLFADRDFTAAQAVSFLAGAVMLALSTYLPQYAQFVRGSSPTAGGLLLLPLMLGMLGAQTATGHWVARTGRYRALPVLGGALTTAGVALLLLLDGHTAAPLASGLTAVAGAGLGLLTQSSLLITTYSAPTRDAGAASGTVTLLRTLGGSLGIAVLGALYAGRLRDGLPAGAATDLTPADLRGLPDPAREAFVRASTDGLHALLLGALLLAAAAFAVARLVRGRQLPVHDTAPGPGGG
ncbi:MDR family MFS transporter [Kitasatospora phosalacinea]|uniref:MDR family MFS transporter n=1 Tax=Kitasatospora phosalacinea TaxID=2065 RepID=UPI0035DF1093